MSLFDLLGWTVALICPLLVGWGLTLLGPPHEKFGSARLCFWISAALLWTYSTVWGWHSKYSFGLTAFACVLLALTGAVGLFILLRTAHARERGRRAEPLSRPIAYEPAGVSLHNGVVTRFSFGVTNNATTLMRVSVASAELRIGEVVVASGACQHAALLGQRQSAYWHLVPGSRGVPLEGQSDHASFSVGGVLGDVQPNAPSLPGSATISIVYDDVPARGLRRSLRRYEFPAGVGGCCTKVVEQDEF